MNITCADQLHHGMEVVWDVFGTGYTNKKVKGTINTEEFTSGFFICQNFQAGANCKEKFGYRNSFIVPYTNIRGLTCNYAQFIKAKKHHVIRLLTKIYKISRGEAIRFALDKMIQYVHSSENPWYIDNSDYNNTRVVYYTRSPNPNNMEKCKTTTSVGRFIRRVIGITEAELSPADLETLCGRISIPVIVNKKFMDSFTIVSGNDLCKAYMSAVGSRSCMTGSHPEYSLQLYKDNPNKIKLLIGPNNSARALLWISDDGKLFIDRVYSNNYKTSIKQYTLWARKKKAYLRTVIPSPTSRFRVTIEGDYNGDMPYFDTMQITYSKNKLVLTPKY